MSNTINNIAHYYEGKEDMSMYGEALDRMKALILEDTLTEVCNLLAKAERLTGDKKIDIEYLLNVVGSYLMGIQEGSLDKETTEPPSKLFEESLFPALQNIDTNVEKEIENDDTEDTGDAERVASE